MKSFLLICLVLALAFAKEYKKYPGVDCTGNDIKRAGTNEPEELMKICDTIEECIGFNTHGWLKKSCPNQETMRDVDSYLDSSIFVPTGKEPDVLLWPMPAKYSSGEHKSTIDPVQLRFRSNVRIEELDAAIDRFKETIFAHRIFSSPAGSITEVVIEIAKKEVDFVTMKDESYTLTVPADGSAIRITADNIYGVYHALNSLMFLIQFDFEAGAYVIKHTPYDISDHPQLHYRALMIDSSRHFLPVRAIKRIVEAMSWVKMNVLHWHLVDDQSFPFMTPSVPDLWKGSFSLEERYTTWDIEDVVTYAKARGIHVVAEIDVPGHSESWCVGAPDICPSKDCRNPLDPTKDLTFEVIDKVLSDLVGGSRAEGLFPGEFMHIGGDEVDTKCWEQVAHIKEWMVKNNYTTHDAYGYFVSRVEALVRQRQRQTIVWEEVYVAHKKTLPKDVLVHIWLGDGERLKEIVDNGFHVILSNYKHWYLPQLWETWDYYYTNDIYKGLTEEQHGMVFGGEVCMWGEWVDTSDLESTIMPRAIAAAERMWTQPELLNKEKAAERLPYIRCEYNRRGISASPTFMQGRSAPAGPGSCMKQ